MRRQWKEYWCGCTGSEPNFFTNLRALKKNNADILGEVPAASVIKHKTQVLFISGLNVQ
jgi:hypothetical protein